MTSQLHSLHTKEFGLTYLVWDVVCKVCSTVLHTLHTTSLNSLMQATEVKEYLTIKEACDLMQVSRRTLYNWIEKFNLATKRNKNQLLLYKDDLEDVKTLSSEHVTDTKKVLSTKMNVVNSLFKESLETLKKELDYKNQMIEKLSQENKQVYLLESKSTLQNQAIQKLETYQVGFWVSTTIAVLLVVLEWVLFIIL